MKVVFIITEGSGRIKKSYDFLRVELKKFGIDTGIITISSDSSGFLEHSKIISSSDFILIGSTVGFWSGAIPESLAGFIKKCKTLEGKRVAIFVEKVLVGSDKAIKKIMKIVEAQGAFVLDFEVITGGKKLKDFFARLLSVFTVAGRQ